MTERVLVNCVMLLDFANNALQIENVSYACKDLDWMLKKTSASLAWTLKAAKPAMKPLALAAKTALH